MRTVPWLGRSWPVASCNSVDLPAPLGPSRPVTPGGTRNVSLLRPMTLPYHLETASNSMMGCIRLTTKDTKHTKRNPSPFFLAVPCLSWFPLLFQPVQRLHAAGQHPHGQ